MGSPVEVTVQSLAEAIVPISAAVASGRGDRTLARFNKD